MPIIDFLELVSFVRMCKITPDYLALHKLETK